VLDSLNEKAYYDDRQVVSIKAVKEYCNEGSGSTDVTLVVLDDEGEEVVEDEEEEEIGVVVVEEENKAIE